MDSSIVKIIDVNVNEIIPNRFQPRRQFDEEEIMELSESIRKYGVIQPLVVRPTGDKYEIIAGERRYKASVLAGLEYIPVIVRNLTDKDSAELAIIENIQRRNLSAIEEALSYKKVLDMGYLTQEDLAAKIGKSQPTIANKIRLLNLSDEVQEALLENKISERHARSLLRLSDIKEQNEMLERIINERLTVRKLDDEIDKIKEEESGEVNMNGETNIPEMPQMESLSVSPSVNSMPTFDMFGTNGQGNVEPAQPEASQPEFAMPQLTPQPEAPQPEFAMPQMPAQPEAPQPEFAMPQLTPQPEAPQPEFAMPQMPAQPEAAQPEFAMPQLPAQPEAAQPEFAMPQMPAQPEAPQPEFAMPQMPAQPEAAQPEFAMPQMPAQPEAAQPEFAMPQLPAQPEAPQPEFAMPQMPAQPEAPQPEFAMPQLTPQPELEAVSDVSSTNPQVGMPTTSPIIEQPEQVVPQMPAQPEAPQPEFAMPQIPEEPVQEALPEANPSEPIIVTDYSKQYDPVMPNAPAPIEKVDFKVVIDAIRECSSKIEQYGYTIDVEEYDLANLYQVVFKIEK